MFKRERKWEKDRELKRDILIWKKEKNLFYLKRKFWEIEKEKVRNRMFKRERWRERDIFSWEKESEGDLFYLKRKIWEIGREKKERVSNSIYRGK